MKSKYYFDWFFLFLLSIILWCLAENSDCKKLQSVTCQAYDLTIGSNSKYEASEIKLQGDAIIEVAAFAPKVNSLYRNTVFFNSPLVKGFPKSDFSSSDINLLSLIRKDNLFLSILRI